MSSILTERLQEMVVDPHVNLDDIQDAIDGSIPMTLDMVTRMYRELREQLNTNHTWMLKAKVWETEREFLKQNNLKGNGRENSNL